MRAGGGHAGERDGFAALDLVFDGGDARPRERAVDAVDVPPAEKAFEHGQRELKPGRAEPGVAWPDPHDLAKPPEDSLVGNSSYTAAAGNRAAGASIARANPCPAVRRMAPVLLSACAS